MRIILRITAFAFRKHKARLALAYFSVIGAALVSLALPRILGETVDQVLKSNETSALYFSALLLLGVGIARGLFGFGQQYLAESLSQKVAYDLRNIFFDRLQRLSFAFHDKHQTGDLMSRATVDVEGVRMFLNMGLVRSAFMVIMVIGIATIMFTTNVRLALLAMIFVPFMAFKTVTMSVLLRRTWMRIQTLTGEMVTTLQENLSGMRVVKAFAAEEFEQRKFNRRSRLVANNLLEANRLQASNIAVMTFAFTMATALILYFGGQMAISGREVVTIDGETVTQWNNLSPGGLVSFLFYMALLQMPIRMMGLLVNAFSRAASSGERIFQILDSELPVKEKKDAKELVRVDGRVTFENVTFSYDSYFPALKSINLDIPAGKMVALLGEPGSGKTTLVHLLSRFYDVSSGTITIDGIDIRDLTLASLRRNVGIIQQDVFVFTASVRDNIAYGITDAPIEKIEQAAKLAQLHDFIMELPYGYDTWVGERGVTLSGGQRQRLAIARTLILDPPILILDDSMSSVDARTERAIQTALAEVVKERTTFIIAHRLSTVKNTDFVFVLKDGQIVERGTHRELLALGGIYSDIYEMQIRPQKEVALEQASGSVAGEDK